MQSGSEFREVKEVRRLRLGRLEGPDETGPCGLREERRARAFPSEEMVLP